MDRRCKHTFRPCCEDLEGRRLLSTFQAPQLVVQNFGYDAGGWRVDQHPRFVVDVTGDGVADIVGFGNAGVYVSRASY